ncbi:hypothetical protein [Siphonobacter sp. BAB-5385]|uniref:hypothetical protein n=1 Tax=Siphonobacter sp. BAB-5385 TaxID=1864822 RepID=UPI001C3CE097|nr:hypothetical protein [Siphonobacter sp. BAB-5385]
MTQLINPWRYGLFTLLYESEAPEGEMIIEYAEREAKQEKHIGETPIRVAEEVVEHGRKAVRAIDEATPAVTKDREEFKRLRNDVYAQNAMLSFTPIKPGRLWRCYATSIPAKSRIWKKPYRC